MFFTLRILCWTCTAKDLSLRDEIIFLMVCPRVIIWVQILIRPRELGPLGHFYRVLSSVQMCKFKNLIQIESNWVIFDWFSSRLLTWKWLSLDIIQVLQKPLPRHLERRVGSRLTQTWCHLYHRVGGSHDHGESRGHERHRSWGISITMPSPCPRHICRHFWPLFPALPGIHRHVLYSYHGGRVRCGHSFRFKNNVFVCQNSVQNYLKWYNSYHIYYHYIMSSDGRVMCVLWGINYTLICNILAGLRFIQSCDIV